MATTIDIIYATTVYERILALALEWLDPDPFVFAAAAVSFDH